MATEFAFVLACNTDSQNLWNAIQCQRVSYIKEPQTKVQPETLSTMCLFPKHDSERVFGSWGCRTLPRQKVSVTENKWRDIVSYELSRPRSSRHNPEVQGKPEVLKHWQMLKGN
jgi:hypothetical protein